MNLTESSQSALIRELHDEIMRQDHVIRQSCDEVTRCHARIHELVDELAPIRALKEGSWQWAMVQNALGKTVREKTGYRASLFNEKGEPYYLHVEPEPTAADFCDIIEEIERTWQSDHCTNHGRNIKKAMELVARVKRKEPTP